MNVIPIPCPRCDATVPLQHTVCPRCRATVQCRLAIQGPTGAASATVTRLAIGLGFGPDAVTVRSGEVVFTGSAAAQAAIARAAAAEGFTTTTLPPSVGGRVRIGSTRARLTRALVLVAALALAGAAGWLLADRGAVAAADTAAIAPEDTVAGTAPGTTEDTAPGTTEDTAQGTPEAIAEDTPKAPPEHTPEAISPTDDPPPADAPAADPLAFAPAIVQAAVRGTVHIVTGRGIGSGVIVSPQGLVLTNAHVVGVAETVEVKLHDGRALPGKVITSRRGEDLALVTLELPRDVTLEPIPIGEAMTLAIGDPVFIVGSPHGHDFSINRGFVSNPRRWLARKPCVQLDIPINPGNSGGPLLDREGRLVGINTYKGAEAEGIGYAQMIERARTGADAILAPHLGLVASPPEFTALMARADEGRPELMLPRDALEEARTEALATTGVLMTAAAWFEPASREWIERCPWAHASDGYCRYDVVVAVMALTRRGVRPAIDGARLHLVIGGEVQPDSLSALDDGWRSHLLQDPDALARFDALGEKLGAELSLWSSTYRYDGFRVARLAPRLDPPFRVVLRYGAGRQTSSIKLPKPTRIQPPRITRIPVVRHRRSPSRAAPKPDEHRKRAR
ncbi:MAG: trypsin-like peptidase domain-containing protein [bacterium]